MKQYEITLILAPDLDQEDLSKRIGAVENMVQELGGLLEKQGIPKKIALGVAIKGNSQGFLGSLIFSLNPENLAQLTSKLSLETTILRSIIQEFRRPQAQAPVLAKPVLRAAEEQKIVVEDIDKKLEEIFKNTPL